MLYRNRMLTFTILAILALIFAACSAQAKSESGTTQIDPAGQVAEIAGDTGIVEEHQDDNVPAVDDHEDTDDHSAGDEHADSEMIEEAEHQEEEHQEGDATAEHMADTDHMESDEHSEADDTHAEGGHDEGDEHGVPAEAMAVENPVAATAEAIAAGAASYTQYCAVCHGNEGKGDGPGAAGLNPKPADFSEEHVQVLSDGGLFWFITNGVPDSAMPPWGGALSEQQRWELVNFLRTFKSK